MGYFVVSGYTFAFIACMLGAFSKIYAGTLIQKLAIAIIAIWCVSRINSLISGGYWIPQETLLALGLVLLAAGTFCKTCFYHGKYRRHN